MVYGEFGKEPMSNIVKSIIVIFWAIFLMEISVNCVYVNFRQILDFGIFQSEWLGYI